MNSIEIDEGREYIGYQQALKLVYTNVHPIGIDEVNLDLCAGRIVASDLIALVDYPSSDVSLKDGFAVKSEDVSEASPDQPVHLQVIGSVFAGSEFEGVVSTGSAVKICSGSPIPQGTSAVVSDEFCEEGPSGIFVKTHAEHGRNVLSAGEEVKAKTTTAQKGTMLLPGVLGLIAAAGISQAKVYRRPRITIIAVGDEIVTPGRHLLPGQLYASNIVTISAWLASFNISHDTGVVGDNENTIRQELLNNLEKADIILTSGGAWGSERDLVVGVLDNLGWQKIFHHVRIGPGKGIAFGLWQGKPVFCLPGGPASNEMAFLQLALPGILYMTGQCRHPLQTIKARLTQNLKARHRAWTEFREAILYLDTEGNYTATLYRNKSRLQSIAHATCLICIPEDIESLCCGEVVSVQLLIPTSSGLFLPVTDRATEKANH
ncbi:gephyrin-like molybdotransferase Glp [Chloroflexota bacterium]